MLEDVACIVFLAHYLEEFLGKTGADDAKLARILVKNWMKMSALGMPRRKARSAAARARAASPRAGGDRG
jgi:hypothetical protein